MKTKALIICHPKNIIQLIIILKIFSIFNDDYKSNNYLIYSMNTKLSIILRIFNIKHKKIILRNKLVKNISKDIVNNFMMMYIGKDKIGQVLLRLMISVKKMSGSKFGEFGYLNYLKNNLGDSTLGKGQFITEDKFGNKKTQQL